MAIIYYGTKRSGRGRNTKSPSYMLDTITVPLSKNGKAVHAPLKPATTGAPCQHHRSSTPPQKVQSAMALRRHTIRLQHCLLECALERPAVIRREE